MSYVEVEYPKEKGAFYRMLAEQVALYTEGEPDQTAALSNASAVLACAFPGANWVGFYLAAEDSVLGNAGGPGELKLGPFQGKPAVTRIAYGRGVCGTAWRERRAQVVEEVSRFPGHIACDCDSRAELVIPLFREDGSFFGVLDMDSVIPGYFTEEDRDGLTAIVPLLLRA